MARKKKRGILNQTIDEAFEAFSKVMEDHSWSSRFRFCVDTSQSGELAFCCEYWDTQHCGWLGDVKITSLPAELDSEKATRRQEIFLSRVEQYFSRQKPSKDKNYVGGLAFILEAS